MDCGIETGLAVAAIDRTVAAAEIRWSFLFLSIGEYWVGKRYYPGTDYRQSHDPILVGASRPPYRTHRLQGAWLSLWLDRLGADVFGLALAPATDPSLFSLTRQTVGPQSAMVDLRDRASIGAFVEAAQPQIVIHMAAQALVRESYRDPLGTFATNILGTANLLDALRGSRALEAALVVTTDKVYENEEKGRAFVETDRLGGKDPV